jgi:hypothetical protein
VGSYTDSSGVSQTLIERYDGTQWSIVSSPAESFESTLDGMSCVSASDCWAVGSSWDNSNLDSATLVEQYDGGQWSIVPSPNPSGSTRSKLDSVTCVSASDCWAVGGTLIEQYDGTQWSIISSPTPSDSSGTELTGVTCATSNDCWAVGSYTDSSGNVAYSPLVEQYDGTQWSIVSSPTPSESPWTDLTGVTCVTASDCWAVGSYYDSGDNQYTLIEQYDGTQWSTISSPTPSDGGQLNSVTCATATDCLAVGDSAASDTEGAVSKTLIEQT